MKSILSTIGYSLLGLAFGLAYLFSPEVYFIMAVAFVLVMLHKFISVFYSGYIRLTYKRICKYIAKIHWKKAIPDYTVSIG